MSFRRTRKPNDLWAKYPERKKEISLCHIFFVTSFILFSVWN